MREISIKAVLALLDDDQEARGTGICFLKSDGTTRSMRAVKNYKGKCEHSTRRRASSGFRPRVHHNLKKTGNVMLYDLDLEAIREVKAAMIFGYFKEDAKNWINVKH
jgi:hypothetical protein